MDSSDESKESFIQHVFYFNDKSKADLLNIAQYSLISIVPIVLLNKLIAKFVPEADDQKGSLEISAEILLQMYVMLFGLFMINRFITYFPTYSGIEYAHGNVIYMVLAILMITISLQTRLGEKCNILVERITELWEGKPSNKQNNKNHKNNKNNNNVKVSQPISGQNMMSSQAMNQSAMNQAMYTDGTSINSLPNGDMQQLPNYNNMHQQDNTPLVNAQTPGMEGFGGNQIMAANEVLGGSFGSSW
jgi:hypothetical protein